jgi:cob(I)alamin adenosyltransferase
MWPNYRLLVTMKKDYSGQNRPGDQGKTVLFDGSCNKNSVRVEAYGAVDELNSLLGMAGAKAEAEGQKELADSIALVQNDLFVLGAQLATKSETHQTPGKGNQVTTAMVKRLEAQILEWSQILPPVTKFILPGGTQLAGIIHFARATSRRTERRIFDLNDTEPIGAPALAYINRLSDWLYMAARIANHNSGKGEIFWNP